MISNENKVAQDKEKLCLSVSEAGRKLGISRGLAYKLARSGQLPVIRFGRRLLVPKIALERLLDQLGTTSKGV